MNAAIQRLLPAGMMTLALHGSLLSWQMKQSLEILPKPLPQRIYVALRKPRPPQPIEPVAKQALPAPKPKSSPPREKPVKTAVEAKVPKLVKKPAVLPTIRPKTGRIKKKIAVPKQRKAAAVRPLVQKNIFTKQLPPLSEIVPVIHKKLNTLPPAQGKIVRYLPPSPKISPIMHKRLSPLPPAQGIITKHLPTPPEIFSVIREALSPLPPEPVREVAVRPAIQDPEDAYPDIPWETVPSSLPAKKVAPEDPVISTKTVLPKYPHQAQSTSSQERYVRRTDVVSANHSVVSRQVSSGSASDVREAAPLYQSNPPPKYPRQARRRGLQGVVTIEALIDSNGRVKDLRIFAGSGHRILDQAALKAVRNWRFTPGTVSGRRRQMWVKVPVRFELR